ncbi:DUF4097 domain-containing protein [Chloroflexia bacterium SDU3-3]|nr:DUF4097 domain-containing protein [Chloroflexia bacterium SDU3-3]
MSLPPPCFGRLCSAPHRSLHQIVAVYHARNYLPPPSVVAAEKMVLYGVQKPSTLRFCLAVKEEMMPERQIPDTPYQPQDIPGYTPPAVPPMATQRQRTTRALGAILMVFGLGWLGIALHENTRPPQDSVATESVSTSSLLAQTYPTQNLMLDISNGTVDVSTWDRSETQIEIVYEGGAPEDYDLRQEARGDTLEIHGGPKPYLPISGDRQLSYHITIPKSGSVNIRNTVGDISVADVDGPVTIAISTGTISASNLGGKLSASTTNGDIHVEGLQGSLVAQSTNGSISLTDSHSRDVQASTVTGDIDIEGASGKIALQNTNGSIAVHDAQESSLSLNTVNGDITFDGALATSAKHTLNTVSGSVDMRIPENSDLVLHADTSSGAISIGDGIELQRREENPASVSGTLGKGGAELQISTVTGDIQVQGE